ncbi:MAG: hypothetical protein HQM00_03990 [Magnetococcales bacterium]|nr:hypothetical protein [Magnetococcales bacterium]
MKGFLARVGKRHGTGMLIAVVAPLAAACGHTIDPTQAPMTTYEMPAAVVVHTAPAMINPATPWQTPMPGNSAAYATAPATSGASPSQAVPPATDANGYPTGSTVVRQAPITIERPAIVVNQPPIWVGNPPVAIPQPPVVMHQAPITVEQPSFVIQPPRVGFQVPQPAPTTVVESKPVPEPKVAPPSQAVEEKAKPEPAKAPVKAQKKSKKPVKKKVVRKSQEPSRDLPPK